MATARPQKLFFMLVNAFRVYENTALTKEATVTLWSYSHGAWHPAVAVTTDGQ